MEERDDRGGAGVDWLRGRLRWEDRLDRIRRDALVPMPGPAAGGVPLPVVGTPEPVPAAR